MHFACLGVGAGPSNLSLASLLYNRPNIKNIFFDKKTDFTWHDGLQLPGTYLQVSLFKDLVLLADPTSKFSFISYLHAQGRIYQFLNAQFDRVSRREFSDYMKWAGQSNPNIVFGEEVLSVDVDDCFVIETSKRRVTAENISVGVGIKPYLPAIAQGKQSQTQFHVSEFAWRAKDLANKRVVIVGGGQSGAEAFLDSISRSGDSLPSSVKWISRRPNFLPLDDTPFVNDYFMPCFSDLFYSLSQGSRSEFLANNILASDGISEQTLREIYQKIYEQQFVEGRGNLISLIPNRNVTQVLGREGDWRVVAQHNEFESDEVFDAEVIVWATGFRTADMDFLSPIAHRIEREGGEFRVNSDFSTEWDGPAGCRIFMQNASPKQRGLAERNLSLLAWRSQRILERITGTRSQPQLPSFVDWSPAPETQEQKLA